MLAASVELSRFRYSGVAILASEKTTAPRVFSVTSFCAYVRASPRFLG
jgi:hypothetical protein